jgi:hypothetical protein
MTEALLVLLTLAREVAGASEALKAVSELIAKAQAEGREVSLDDLKTLELKGVDAIASLTNAIGEAEG